MTYIGLVGKITSLFLLSNTSVNILLLICGVCFMVGYVIVRRIRLENQRLDRVKILLSPLFGFSFLAVFLNVFYIFGLEMKYLVWPIFLELLVSSFFLIKDRFKLFNLFSLGVLLVALMALLFSSVGLFNLGKNYLGYGWVDSLNYVAFGEITKDFSINIPTDVLLDKPQYLPGLAFREDRIAQSLVNVFFSLAIDRDIKTVFGPLLLSSVFLFSLSIFLLTYLFVTSRLKSILIAFNIAISSAFAMIHIETFLSHALAIPIVILYAVLVELFKKSCNLYNAFCLGLVVATLFFLYPELLPVLVIISLPYLFDYINKKRIRWSLVFLSSTLVLFFINRNLILNLLFNRVGTRLVVLDPIYSFSGSIFMLNRMLFGHIDLWNIQTWLSIVIAFLAVVNLVFVVKNKEKEKRGLVAAMLFLIVLIPLSFTYKYHYIKLFLTVSPFVILSFYLFILRFVGKFFYVFLIVCLFFSAKGTRDIIRYTYLSGGRSQIGGLYYGEDQSLEESLKKTSGEKLLINGRNSMETAWLAYYGRNNKVKVVSNEFAMRDISTSNPELIFDDYQNIAEYKIISTQKFPEVITSESIKIYPYFVNNQGLEGVYPNQFSWIGDEAEFGFINQFVKPAIGHVYMELNKGSFDDSDKRGFSIISNSKLIIKKEFIDKSYSIDFPVTLYKGKNSYFVQTQIVKPILSSTADTRKFNMLLSNLKLFLCDGSFEKLYYIMPETDGWVTNKGLRIIGCLKKGGNEISIDFGQIVNSGNKYDFLINGRRYVGERIGNKLTIGGVGQLVNDNYLSVNIMPGFSRKIGEDTRELSFFPINYSRN